MLDTLQVVCWVLLALGFLFLWIARWLDRAIGMRVGDASIVLGIVCYIGLILLVFWRPFLPDIIPALLAVVHLIWAVITYLWFRSITANIHNPNWPVAVHHCKPKLFVSTGTPP